MNRLYLLALILITGAALLGMAIVEHPGYVLVAYRNFRFESSLWAALALIGLVWLTVYVARLLLRGAATSGGLINPWSRRHQQRRVRQAARLGMLDLAEGRWSEALRHLSRAAEKEPKPLLLCLGAARAANELGEHEQSDTFLTQAQASDPKAEVAVGLTRAQLLIDRRDYEQALACLQALHADHPKHGQVLKLLQQLYVERRDWSALCRLMPELRRHNVRPSAELDQLEQGAWLYALGEGGGTAGGDVVALQGLWKQVPGRLRERPEVLRAYAERLHALGATDEAVKLLAATIKQDYSAQLVYRYGLLPSSDPALQLKKAEAWLQDAPNDPLLLLTLGRLSVNNQLWGKARSYFEASLRFNRSPEACSELARLLAQLGEQELSNQLFQEGLELLNQQQSRVPAQLPPATPETSAS